MTVYAPPKKRKHLLIISMAPQEPGTSQQTRQTLKTFPAHGETPVFPFQDRALPTNAGTDPAAGQIPGDPVTAEGSCAAIGGPALAPGYPLRQVCRGLSVGGHRAMGVIPQLHRHILRLPIDSAGVYRQTSQFLNAGRIPRPLPAGRLLDDVVSPERMSLRKCPFPADSVPRANHSSVSSISSEFPRQRRGDAELQ